MARPMECPVTFMDNIVARAEGTSSVINGIWLTMMYSKVM